MKKIFLVRGDTPPETLEGVWKVVIYQFLRLGKSFTGHAVNTRFTRKGKRRWLGKLYVSGCRYDLDPKDLEHLFYTSEEEVLEEIGSALKERDYTMLVTLYCEDGDGED